VELFDNTSERDAYIENLIAIGYVTGVAGIDNIGEAQLFVDKKNYRIVIRAKYDKNMNNYSDDYEICYNIDGITEFKYEGCNTQNFINRTDIRDFFKLIISDTHSIDFYVEKRFSNTDANKDKHLRLNLIFAFIHLIEDEATISWVNEFCENNDLLPLFDETGEVSVKNMKENARLINI